MWKYIVSRLLESVILVVGITFLTFLLLQVLPGDPVTAMMGDRVDPATVARISEEMHLKDPMLVRYFHFLVGMLHGDLGLSYKTNRPVMEMIRSGFPKTLILATTAMLIALMIGIPAGVISAIRQYSIMDSVVLMLALVGISVPVFWTGLVLQYTFGLKLGWLPIAGFSTWRHVVLPGIVLGWQLMAVIARLTRSSVLEVLQADYIRTARGKGLPELQVLSRHVLKNALLPIVTILALRMAGLLSGAVVTESVFGIPGLGRVAVGAIQQRDLPLLQASVMVSVVLVVGANLVADLCYRFIDPRIRLE